MLYRVNTASGYFYNQDVSRTAFTLFKRESRAQEIVDDWQKQFRDVRIEGVSFSEISSWRFLDEPPLTTTKQSPSVKYILRDTKGAYQDNNGNIVYDIEKSKLFSSVKNLKKYINRQLAVKLVLATTPNGTFTIVPMDEYRKCLENLYICKIQIS